MMGRLCDSGHRTLFLGGLYGESGTSPFVRLSFFEATRSTFLLTSFVTFATDFAVFFASLAIFFIRLGTGLFVGMIAKDPAFSG